MTELPAGWETATIDDLAGSDGLVTDGDWIESKDQDPSGDVRLIQLADIGDGSFRNRSSRFVTTETARRLNCTYLQDGDLLIARMPDPLGRACIFPGVGQDAITAVDVFIWRNKAGNIQPRWLMHFINSPEVRAAIEAEAGGTTRQRIAGGRLKKLSIPVPPSGEQRLIVEKIDSLSGKSKRARDHLDHVTKLVRKYREAVLALAFRGGLTQDLRSDEQGERPNSELPIGWRWSIVGDVASVTGGLTKNSKRASLPIEVPYMRVANVYSNELRLEDVQQIRCSQRELDTTALNEGDLLVVEGNGSLDQIGRVAIWDGSIEPCSHQNHLIRVRAHRATQPKHILYWLLSPLGRAAIESVASSSSGLHTLSISKVSSIRIPICPENESLEIIRRIEAAFAWIDRLASEATSARKLIDHLDQAILSKAFRGELVPQDPNDEPASVLLERIRAERAGATAGKGRRGRSRKDAV